LGPFSELRGEERKNALHRKRIPLKGMKRKKFLFTNITRVKKARPGGRKIHDCPGRKRKKEQIKIFFWTL